MQTPLFNAHGFGVSYLLGVNFPAEYDWSYDALVGYAAAAARLRRPTGFMPRAPRARILRAIKETRTWEQLRTEIKMWLTPHPLYSLWGNATLSGEGAGARSKTAPRGTRVEGVYPRNI